MAWHKVRQWCVFLILSDVFFVTIALFSRSRFVVFAIFLYYIALFLSRIWEVRDQGA